MLNKMIGVTARHLTQEVDRDTAVEIIHAGGRVRANGRRYEGEIVRVWTFRGRKLARVRSFYDTAAYVAAMQGL